MSEYKQDNYFCIPAGFLFMKIFVMVECACAASSHMLINLHVLADKLYSSILTEFYVATLPINSLLYDHFWFSFRWYQ